MIMLGEYATYRHREWCSRGEIVGEAVGASMLDEVRRSDTLLTAAG